MSVAVWKPEEETSVLVPFVEHGGEEIQATWAPQQGSQEAFLACPIFEVLYEGTRGPGKTDALLMDFAQHVGKGFGPEWKGILFRQSYPELKDVIEKSKKWFKKFWPSARYNIASHEWEFPNGELLLLRFMKKADEYWNYHGHAYPWIAFEELTNWPDSDCYTSMMSCSRSTIPEIPRKYRASCNPYGVGHNWVKKRFRLPIGRNKVCGPVIKDSIGKDGKVEPPRVAIHGELQENKILLHAEPDYVQKICAAARNKNEMRAWVKGDWNITAGGMLDDIWNAAIHVLPNIPIDKIPRQWKLNRSYDHGQSKPFSVGWWAESNGEPFEYDGVLIGKVAGDLIRVTEWYGCRHNEENVGVDISAIEIGEGIRDREKDWNVWKRVKRGPADTNIFDEYQPNKSIEKDMSKAGIHWDRADKGPGSRKQGWLQFRTYLKGSISDRFGIREKPGLFVCERCTHFIRTVPVLPRSDKDLDDVNSESEDHIGDESRYRLRWKPVEIQQGSF